MGERDDGLGLSLSLTLSQPSLKPNLPPLMTSSSSSSPPHIIHKIHHNNWPHLFQSSERNADVGRFFRRGFDVNKAPASVTAVEVEEDGEGGVSSPKSTVSSVSGNKRSERDLVPVNDGERASCSHGGGSDDEDGGANGGDGSRKKLRLSKEQGLVLEETFKEHSTLNPKQKVALAKQLNLRPRQVEVWFQNRRARTKLKQTEVDCEYLKRCCDNLTEENRRLQKEVTELRTLKLSPHLYMHMTPPTTLTMCPSCERLAVSSAANVNPTVRRPSPQRPGPGSPWTGISLQSRPGH